MADSIDDHHAPLAAAVDDTTIATTTATQRSKTYVQVERGMLSRVLYPNPVCLLSVWDATQHVGNVMTITWLTPINNQVCLCISLSLSTARVVATVHAHTEAHKPRMREQGGFICSVNCNRHTAKFIHTPGDVFGALTCSLVRSHYVFTLAVARRL